MLVILYYCLKVIICSGLLFGYYLLALRNNRFHQWNRFYLLAVVVISFTLPLIKVKLPFFSDKNEPVIQSLSILSAPDIYFSKLHQRSFDVTWPMMLGALYVCIAILLIIFFIRNILKVQRLKRLYPRENLNGIHFYNTSEPGTPFSFFKNIFWNSSISLNNERGQQMLRHELTHIHEQHSVDKAGMEILIALAWWNPFLYYIRKELSVIHEFIADKKASAGDDNLQYASLLLMKAMGSRQFALGNPFFHSQLRRRLLMLTSNKNPRFSYLRRLLVLPLAAISLILFSFKYKEIKDKQKALSTTHAATTGEDEFYGDTTRPRFYVQLDKTYKGSAIESIMPTTDMSGAIIKTMDDKTYFVDRAAAAKELNFIITDSGFTAPPGAVLVTGTDKVVARNGAFIQTGPYSHFPQYRYTVDTTASGLSKVTGSNAVSLDNISINQNNDIHTDINITGGSFKINNDVKTDGLEKALIIVDGVKIDMNKLKTLDLQSFKSMDILKSESAIARYGVAGKNGVILIFTKAKETRPDNPLYILDGVESTKEIVAHILPDNIQSVDVLKGEAATNAYGEKGKNGVIKITTKLAKNEVTFPEAKQNDPLVEKVVTGHRISKDGSVATSGANATLTRQPEDLKEVVVVGYDQKEYDQVFTKVDKPASFPGGLEGWRRYLMRSLQYPVTAQEKGTQGTVRVQMIVDEEGNITELKALNDPGNGLGEEAVRVISKGPKWVPAEQNGHKVTYRFVQTLTFQLQ